MENSIQRMDIDHYFMDIAYAVAVRSTCRRHSIGALAVRDNRILTTGYNGAPAGMKDCLELGCIRNELSIPSATRIETCRAVHAEANVVIQAARHGVNIKESIIYCTHTPCVSCAKMLVNAGIVEFVYDRSYDDEEYLAIFEDAGITVRNVPKITYKLW